MNLDESRVRIGRQRSVVSRAKDLALKALVVVCGALTLASAFFVSLVFLVIGMAVVLALGGYLWWKTRELRWQMRERMQRQAHFSGEIIEGEVISPAQLRADRRR